MSRIADEQRGSSRTSRSDARLAERREALRRAVSDLGDVTSRFRTRLGESGHEVSPAPPANGSAPSVAASPLQGGASHSPAPLPRVAPPPLDSSAPTGEHASQRDAAMADARMRFESVSRQADELVRTITEAVRSETAAFRANIEVGAETRFREIEVEAQRRLRRAQAEADALVDQRRRRIAEVSDRILELGEDLAGRLADADEVKGQFDLFVQALGQASDRLARDRETVSGPAEGSVSDLATRLASDPPAGLAEAA